MWVFVPWWPIKNFAAASVSTANSYLDDIFFMLSWFGITLDILIFVSVRQCSCKGAVRRTLTRFPLQFCWHIRCLLSEHIDGSNQEQRWRNVIRRCLYSFLFTFPVLTIVSFLFAGANYFILYHVTPFFISRLLFHCYMCALLLRFGIMLAAATAILFPCLIFRRIAATSLYISHFPHVLRHPVLDAHVRMRRQQRARTPRLTPASAATPTPPLSGCHPMPSSSLKTTEKSYRPQDGAREQL
jgi:hypothetical protein